MYSTSNAPDGPVNVVRIESYTESDGWRRASLTPDNVGMNPAEVEGQLPRFVASPDLLGSSRRRTRVCNPKTSRGRECASYGGSTSSSIENRRTSASP